jgi:polar amino acid transport system substrate-binding protein
VALLLVAGLVAAACGDDGGGDSESASDDTTTTADGGGGAAACVAEVELQAPGELTVAAYPDSVVPPGELDQVPDGRGRQAYESAVLYAVADQLGFAEDQVVVEEVADDAAASPFVHPGEKDFDLAISNITVTPGRDVDVDFVVYYDEQQVLVAPEDSVVVGAASVGDLSDDTFGTIRVTASRADGAGTAYVEEVIAPSTEIVEFDNLNRGGDGGDLPAIQTAIDDGTIDALVIDQPSAEFAVTVGRDGQAQITGVSIVGALPRTDDPVALSQLGMLFEEGSELTSCVDLAMTALEDDGTIEGLETEYLRDGGSIPELTE